MNKTKIYKVSLGSSFFSYEEYQIMLQNNLASVHPDTKGKGTSNATQYENFLNVEKGDIVFICRSNESVDAIGIFKDKRPLYAFLDNHYEEWIDREYIILKRAENPKNHNKNIGKWWAPSDNSTCNSVKEEDYKLFEEAILNPVFNLTIDELLELRKQALESVELTIQDILALQQKFDEFSKNDSKIIDELNNLSIVERLKVYYEYGTKENIESQPVVWLRKLIIEYLVENPKLITKEILNGFKTQISKKFPKNVFHVWSTYFRISYPLVYSKHKTDLVSFLNKLLNRFINDLQLESFVNVKIVHFDGPQNQGYNRIWCAIYNKTQKTAKQLFFEINDGFKYGLLSVQNPDINNLITSQVFNYDEVLAHYKLFINDIISDDTSKYDSMTNLKELLEYKKQIILQGPPGTGKTYTAKDLSEFIISNEVNSNKEEQADFINSSKQIEIIQFHPAYTYEDFIRGIVTEPHGEKINYISKDKLFLELVDRAAKDSENPYILIIDEINRANLSSVLGELIYALEYRGQSFQSMYANQKGDYRIVIPDNLYIIGTMNTADRSVGHIDYALRRRFAFYDILPKSIESDDFENKLFEKVSKLFVKEIKSTIGELQASEHLSLEFQDRPQDIWLGHSYFFLKPDTDFKLRVQYEIIPILQEYVKDGILNNTDEVKNIIKDISIYTTSHVDTED